MPFALFLCRALFNALGLEGERGCALFAQESTVWMPGIHQ